MARRPGVTTLAEPAPNKVEFARLVDAQAVRLGYVSAAGVPDRRQLGASCGLSPTTLHLAIKRPTGLSSATLLRLEEGTGVPVAEWLTALGMRGGEPVEEGTLTAAERELLSLARRRGDRWVRETVRWLRSVDAPVEGPAGASDRDSGHGGSPSPEGGT